MDYEWISFGDEDNPVIAFIAPSNGIGGKEGQIIIQKRIKTLIEKGFCVKVPKYKDGQLAVESKVGGRGQSNRLGETISPAVSDQSGANQIIDCVKNGWNIMPFMGGDSFENKIPLIVKYFEENPSSKNPHVKIFGLSNSTYATILASRRIATFISTTFTSIFERAKTDLNFVSGSEQLEKLLKGQEISAYPRKIIYNPDDLLSKVNQTFHYPMNFGNIIWEIEKNQRIEKRFKAADNVKSKEELSAEEDRRSLAILPDQIWSLSIEGFLQRPASQLIVGYAYCLDKFLEQNHDNLPAFIEIGNIATRLDGKNGYENLLHDDKSGEIVIGDYNIDKVYANRIKLAEDIKALYDEKIKLESLINDISYDKISPEQRSAMERQLTFLSFMPEEIFDKVNRDIALGIEGIEPQGLNKDDIRLILEAQNKIQKEIMKDILTVAKKYKIPLTQNTKNGHCVNMEIVNGGASIVNIKDNFMYMFMEKESKAKIDKKESKIESKDKVKLPGIIPKIEDQSSLDKTPYNKGDGRI